MSDETSGGTRAPTASWGVRTLRVWPAAVLGVLLVGLRLVPGWLEGGLSRYWMVAMIGPMLCSLLLVIWWLAASRATWKERVFGFLGLLGALALTAWLVEPMMRGPGTVYVTLPMGMTGFVLGAILLRGNRPLRRTGLSLLLAAIGFGSSILLRNDGMGGDYALRLRWRWAPSAEEQMIRGRAGNALVATLPVETDRTNLTSVAPEWPGFRGADRSGTWHGPLIATNWSERPPRRLWKVPVGPGWSSFAVAGEHLFTQEQRGPMEAVVAYDAASGREVWSRGFEARLEDPMGGPGPRATPTLAGERLFVSGATGLLLCLRATSGEVLWRHDLNTVAAREAPMWGFAGSPLVVTTNVIVWAGGKEGKGLLAFNVETGALRWSAPSGDHTYASPQWSRVAGEDLVLMLSNEGLLLVEPATGQPRLNYEWKFSGYRALQPRVVGEATVLVGTPMNVGTRALRITRVQDHLAAEELWTSRGLKPDFSDFVTHGGYIYGNDGGFLACLDLQTGNRVWKGGRYGKGQVLLLEHAGLLLVAAEDGRVCLVLADPGEHLEVASFQALEGKTWNHPVVVGDKLYVRNSQEAGAWQLPLATATATDRGGLNP